MVELILCVIAGAGLVVWGLFVFDRWRRWRE